MLLMEMTETYHIQLTLNYYKRTTPNSYSRVDVSFELNGKPTWNSSEECLKEVKQHVKQINTYSTYLVLTSRRRHQDNKNQADEDWTALLGDFNGPDRWLSWWWEEVHRSVQELATMKAAENKLETQSTKLEKLNKSFEGQSDKLI